MSDKILLSANNLTKTFGYKNSKTIAVNDISFYIKEGETLGLVGESGSGKTTLGRLLVSLYTQDEGTIIFDGKEINSKNKNKINIFKKEEDKPKKTNDIQMIFQDPIASLNPRMTIRDIVKEGLVINKEKNKDEIDKKVIEVLKSVGLNSDCLNRYPHEFSGGQRQRISIARALILKPKLLIADEIVSSLDISIQAQIINLLKDLKKEYNLSILFIAHNLQIVKYISDRIMIMYKGKIVEVASTKEIFENPIHPYTKKLLSSILSYKPTLNREKVEEENFDFALKEGSLKEVKEGHLVYLEN